MVAGKRSLTGPVVIFVATLALIVTLTVLWNVILAHDYVRIRELMVARGQDPGPFHATFIALGSAFFLTIIVLLSLFGARSFTEISWGRRQQNFLASISHELSSPLQAIKLHAETLGRGDLGDRDRVRFAQMLSEDVDRLGRLVGNVLRAAQIDQRRLPLQADRVLLSDVLAAYVDRRRATLARSAATAELTLSPGPECWVLVDRDLLRQLLDNLVDNAIKYSPADRCRIEIGFRPADDHLELLVRDQGIGLARGEARRIFERFYRVEDGHPDRSRKGTGLGLAIARSIVEAHGWRIRAESAGRDRGTTMRIEIPEFELIDDEPSGDRS